MTSGIRLNLGAEPRGSRRSLGNRAEGRQRAAQPRRAVEDWRRGEPTAARPEALGDSPAQAPLPREGFGAGADAAAADGSASPPRLVQRGSVPTWRRDARPARAGSSRSRSRATLSGSRSATASAASGAQGACSGCRRAGPGSGCELTATRPSMCSHFRRLRGALASSSARAAVRTSTGAVTEHITVPVGAFADLNFPAPRVSVWEERMHPWVGLPDGIEHIGCSRGRGPRPHDGDLPLPSLHLRERSGLPRARLVSLREVNYSARLRALP